jgi:4,5-DOPA dioxygenase extradiol
MSGRMPAFFIGHGNPMNALLDNDFTLAWEDLGTRIPQPAAVLCVSAHWYLPATMVTAMDFPRTIHDFGGFPEELYNVKYPAPGDPRLARHVKDLLSPLPVDLDTRWGLDHGTWSVLSRIFPKADIPVIQLSINEAEAPEYHYDIGVKLSPLRDEGILIVGSGNVVHNLHAYAWGERRIDPYDWALRFDTLVRNLLTNKNDKKLIDYEKLGNDAMLAAPTPDHYLPLLYVIALCRGDDRISFPVSGFDGGSISMLALQIG